MQCNACTREALVVYRILPYQALTLFDATPRNVAACAQHLESARKIGTVLSATPLSDAVAERVVKE